MVKFIRFIAFKKKDLVTADAGLIDSHYRGIAEVLFINHSEKTFIIRTGDRIAQVLLVEQFNAKFEKVTITKRITKRGSGGFGSRAMSVIKQAKKDPNDKEEQKISEAIVKKPGDDLQVVSEEAIMEVDNEVVINKKITISSLFLDDVIFIMTFMPEKMFLVIGASVFGYCFEYFTFEMFKYKNRKEEIHEFF